MHYFTIFLNPLVSIVTIAGIIIALIQLNLAQKSYKDSVENVKLLLKDKQNVYTLEASNYYNKEVRSSLIYSIQGYQRILQGVYYSNLDDETLKQIIREFATKNSDLNLTLLKLSHFAFYFKSNMIDQNYVRAEYKPRVREFLQLPDIELVLTTYYNDTGLTSFKRLFDGVK